MDQYKISQSPDKQGLVKPLKNLLKSKQRIKSLNAKTILIVSGLAIALIIVWLAASFLTSSKAPKTLKTSSNTGSSKLTSSRSVGIPPATFNGLTGEISAKHSLIFGSSCQSSIQLVIVKTGFNKSLSCTEAAQQLAGTIDGAIDPWNFHLPESDIASWQTGSYGQYFNGTSIVGESANGDVIVISFNNSGQVTSVVVIPLSSLDSSTGSSTSTTNSASSGSSTGSTTNDKAPSTTD